MYNNLSNNSLVKNFINDKILTPIKIEGFINQLGRLLSTHALRVLISLERFNHYTLKKSITNDYEVHVIMHVLKVENYR